MEATTSQSGQGKVPIPKFKKRAVSAVRDWPPGCGPATENVEQIAVVSLDDSIEDRESSTPSSKVCN